MSVSIVKAAELCVCTLEASVGQYLELSAEHMGKIQRDPADVVVVYVRARRCSK